MATTTAVLSQEPASLDLAWRVNDAVSLVFVVTGADWTGTYSANIRAKATDPDPIVSMSVATVLVNLDADTQFTLTLSAADSATLGKGKFVWDLEDTGINLTRLSGKVSVSQDVTRA